MTKEEFLIKMKQEKPLANTLITIEVNSLVDSPEIIGCYEENGIWRVYETKERGGYIIIKEFTNESNAFDFLYKVVYSEKKMQDVVKQKGI